MFKKCPLYIKKIKIKINCLIQNYEWKKSVVSITHMHSIIYLQLQMQVIHFHSVNYISLRDCH